MDMIPIHSPKLPSVHAIAPYLEKMDKTRWYSNFGPLVNEFETRLASHFGVHRTNVTTASNGTLMLIAMLKALNVSENSYCIMPSWTFIATAAAAHYSNLIPFFVDVDKKTQSLDPDVLKAQLPLIKKPIGAVIVIAPFGEPIDVTRWDKFTEETKIPVIIDAAAGFDTVGRHMQVGKSPMMISLHATKVFGVGEGGVGLSTDAYLIAKIKAITSFGFNGTREAFYLGFNAKISEYTAAVGLASLDEWAQTRSEWAKVRDYYISELKKINVAHSFSHDWISSTCNVLLPNNADRISQGLNKAGVDTRKWWLNGCHRQHAYQDFPHIGSLTNTEWLSKSVLGLPFAKDLEIETINKVCNTLHLVLADIKDGETVCNA